MRLLVLVRSPTTYLNSVWVRPGFGSDSDFLELGRPGLGSDSDFLELGRPGPGSDSDFLELGRTGPGSDSDFLELGRTGPGSDSDFLELGRPSPGLDSDFLELGRTWPAPVGLSSREVCLLFPLLSLNFIGLFPNYELGLLPGRWYGRSWVIFLTNILRLYAVRGNILNAV